MEIDINKTDKSFKPNLEWMRARYDELNEKIFNNELGYCDFKIMKTGKGSQGKTLGRFRLQATLLVDYSGQMFVERKWMNKIETITITSNNFVQICRPLIIFNGNYSGTEYAFLSTLIHEMCHYYTYMRGKAPTRGHGKEFYRIGDYVNLKSNGLFTIERLASAEDMSNLELNDEMKEKNKKRNDKKKSIIKAVFEYRVNGDIHLTTTSNENLVNLIKNMNERSFVDKVVVSNDMKLLDFLFEKGYRVNFRVWKYWEVSNEPWLSILDDINKEIYVNPNSTLKKKTNESKYLYNSIITEVINEYIKNNKKGTILIISPDTELEKYSPFEI